MSRLNVRYVQEHWLVALAASALLNEARAATLDLDSAASLALNMLDVRSTMADDLCA